MTLPQFLTLPFWNQLARAHMTELVLVLTVAIVVLLDRQFRKLLNKMTRSRGPFFRFLTFLVVCSVGYAALALGTAWALAEGFAIQKGGYTAPIALAVLVVVAIGTERQRQS